MHTHTAHPVSCRVSLHTHTTLSSVMRVQRVGKETGSVGGEGDAYTLQPITRVTAQTKACGFRGTGRGVRGPFWS